MKIQTVAAAGVNTNINTHFKRTTKPVEKAKEQYNNSEDGGKKILTVLSGLAVLSVAGIWIATALRKGKTTPLKDTVNTVRGAQNVINNISQTNIKPAAVSEIINTGQKDVSKTLQQTGRQTVHNTKYIPAKNHSAKSINRNIKPAGENNTAALRIKQAEARVNMLKKNNAVQQTLADANKNIISSAGEIKNAGQGIKSAANIQVLDKKAQTAQNAAQNIADKAKEMKDIAQEIPTHKNIKRAKTAENRAIRAQLDAEKVQKNAGQRKAQIISDAAKKEQNIQQMINNTTPERLLEGQRKMEENAQKTSTRAIQRRANKTINKPGYQRALRQFQNYSEEKLQTVVNSTKSSNIEKTAAQDLLNCIK